MERSSAYLLLSSSSDSVSCHLAWTVIILSCGGEQTKQVGSVVKRALKTKKVDFCSRALAYCIARYRVFLVACSQIIRAAGEARRES